MLAETCVVACCQHLILLKAFSLCALGGSLLHQFKLIQVVVVVAVEGKHTTKYFTIIS